MFSNKDCYKLVFDVIPSVDAIAESHLGALVSKNNLNACIVLVYDIESKNHTIVTSYNIDISPFKGTKNKSLTALITDCYEKHPKPHVHDISKTNFWAELKKIQHTESLLSKIIYAPISARGYNYITLFFYEKKLGLNYKITTAFVDDLYSFMDILSFLMSAEQVSKKLEIMEGYVKEIGHDIASSIQAIIAKLKAVSDGYLVGDLAINKIREAEEEIMATYRIADTLGITVDPDYNIKTGNDFDLVKVINNAISLCKSEADERGLVIKCMYYTQPCINVLWGDEKSMQSEIKLWGDEQAIQTAIIHLLINAIKYADNSTIIYVSAYNEVNELSLDVENTGMPIDDSEKHELWTFGFRGAKAYEMHVNGSGIGLFTVKKIILAHSGSVASKVLPKNGYNKVVFSFKIPKRDIIKRTKLL